MKYAIIGTSWITQAFIDSANTLGELTLGAVYSRSLSRAVEFASKNGCDYAYDDLDTIARSGVDAVYIASPNSLHYEQAKLFLSHGKHVICEKPAVVRPEQLLELHDLAHENGLVFMEAIMMLHQPCLKTVKDALSRLGRIDTARFDFSQYSSRYQALMDGELPNILQPAVRSRLHDGPRRLCRLSRAVFLRTAARDRDARKAAFLRRRYFIYQPVRV